MFQRFYMKTKRFNNERNKHFIDMTRSNGGTKKKRKKNHPTIITIVWVLFLVLKFGEHNGLYVNFVCEARLKMSRLE